MSINESPRMADNKPDHPAALRPQIFDPRIGVRRYFWDELSGVQRDAEMERINTANWQLLKG